jgi:hypothetical protein
MFLLYKKNRLPRFPRAPPRVDRPLHKSSTPHKKKAAEPAWGRFRNLERGKTKDQRKDRFVLKNMNPMTRKTTMMAAPTPAVRPTPVLSQMGVSPTNTSFQAEMVE